MLSLCSGPNHSLTCAWIERRDKGKAWMWPWFPVLFQQHKPSTYSRRYLICILPLKQNSCHELRDISKTIWVIGKDITKILDQKLISTGKGTTIRKINRANLKTKLCMVLCVTLCMNECKHTGPVPYALFCLEGVSGHRVCRRKNRWIHSKIWLFLKCIWSSQGKSCARWTYTNSKWFCITHLCLSLRGAAPAWRQ